MVKWTAVNHPQRCFSSPLKLSVQSTTAIMHMHKFTPSLNKLFIIIHSSDHDHVPLCSISFTWVSKIEMLSSAKCVNVNTRHRRAEKSLCIGAKIQFLYYSREKFKQTIQEINVRKFNFRKNFCPRKFLSER